MTKLSKLKNTIPTEYATNKVEKSARGYFGETDEFPISYDPIKAGVYNIYMFGEIETSSQFIGALEVLNHCTELDTCVIHLQSCGGSLDATDTLLQAIDECEGRVVVRGTGGCHSAATLILLRGDTFTLSEGFNALIHNGSTGAFGKFSDFKSKTLFDVKYFERTMRSAYEGFLTSDEIDSILRGMDMWLDREDWIARHELREAYFQKKAEAFVANLPEATGGMILEESLSILENMKPKDFTDPDVVAELVGTIPKVPKPRKKKTAP